MLNFDVIIIGAGPAGISLGNRLLENNISFCIIDKEYFPRDKLCGGLLTGKTIDLIKELNMVEDIKICYNNSSKKVKMFKKYKQILDINVTTPYYFTDRRVFDHELLQALKNKGGTVLEGITIEKIDTEKKCVLLTNNTCMNYKYLVGADGSNSITRKIVDKNYKPNGFCLELNVPKDAMEYYGNEIGIYFGIVKSGYGWVLPKKDHYTIGIGGIFSKNINYRKIIFEFLDALHVNHDKLDIKGLFLPFGKYVRVPNYKKEVFLVGDAAGFVDPTNGEGIYFSILSGLFTADLIVKMINHPGKGCEADYQKAVKSVQNIISKGNNIHRIIYNVWLQPLLLNIAKGHNHISAYYCDNVISYYHYSYLELFKMIVDYKMKRK